MLTLSPGSHDDDTTDAHAHSHRHQAPLNVDTSSPEHPLHGHPTHPHIAEDAPNREKAVKDIETGSEGAPENGLSPAAEGAAQLIAVAVLEFGVVLHR